GLTAARDGPGVLGVELDGPAEVGQRLVATVGAPVPLAACGERGHQSGFRELSVGYQAAEVLGQVVFVNAVEQPLTPFPQYGMINVAARVGEQPRPLMGPGRAVLRGLDRGGQRLMEITDGISTEQVINTFTRVIYPARISPFIITVISGVFSPA